MLHVTSGLHQCIPLHISQPQEKKYPKTCKQRISRIWEWRLVWHLSMFILLYCQVAVIWLTIVCNNFKMLILGNCQQDQYSDSQ